MLFAVTPSPEVEINSKKAGIDACLRLILENGERLYVRKHTGNEYSLYSVELDETQFTFDLSMPPRGLRRLSVMAARRFMADLQDDERLRLEELYAERTNRQLSLLGFVARELRREPSVKAARPHLSVLPEPINIGTRVEARLSTNVRGLCAVYFDEAGIWRSDSAIAQIQSVDRCDALAEYFSRQ